MSPTGDPRSPKSITIVGGGLIGLSLAWRLAQAGFRVEIFDQGAIGGEASWAGAGMLAPGGEFEAHSPLAALAIESRAMYAAFVRELERISGEEIDYQECGGLELAYSDEESQALEHRSRLQAELGIQSKRLTADQIRTFWPRVRQDNLRGGRFYPGDGIVNPRDVVRSLAKACTGRGVSLNPQTSVDALAIEPNGVTISLPGTTRSYDAAVIAAGAWSSSIPVTGVPSLPPVEPLRGHLLGYAQPEQTCNTIVRRGHTYLLQRANGMLIAGASTERAGFDRTTSPEIAAALAKDAGFLFPHLAETTPTEIWTGFRPASDSPHIGSWHSNRLYLAYGHYRNGILLAPATAQRLSAEISASLGTL